MMRQEMHHALDTRYIVYLYTYGPDRLESIIFDITDKKIDNHHSRLIIEFFL